VRIEQILVPLRRRSAGCYSTIRGIERHFRALGLAIFQNSEKMVLGAFFARPLALALFLAVVVLWLVPDRRIERVLRA
jgi:hypothetical protein